MDTEISSAVLPDDLPPAIAEKLQKLTPGSYCQHRSWGFGKIREWNSGSDSVTIDFKTKAGHAMQFIYAADSLQPLPEEHILVQKAAALPALKQQAADAPQDVVRSCIHSLGLGATVEGIQAALSPDVIPADQWKKWWEGAKRALKKDGHFYVPTKKTEALRMLSAPSALGDQALENFRLAIGPKALLANLTQVTKFWPEIKSDAVLEEVATAIDDALARVPKSQLATAIELAMARDDFFKEAGRPAESGERAVVTLTPLTPNALSSLLEDLPGLKQGKLLDVIRAGVATEWPALFIGLLPRANGRVAETITDAFVEADRSTEIVAAVNRVLRERSVTCDFMHWFCKNGGELFAPLMEPQLIVAILSVLEKDQFSEIKKGTKLYELVLGDKSLVARILKDAPFEDVRDITRAIMLSPVFEELDKRSLLATIIKLYPAVQSMIVGSEKAAAEEEVTLIVSWSSLERRKAELEEIVTRKIPENSKEIGIAREYGDLRENHEFKAAKEMQTVLMRRKAELEQMLMRAQGTDFSNVDPHEVNIGAKVSLVEEEGGAKQTYTILGAWDSDPVQGVISYLTPVARALVTRKVGDVVSLPTDGGGSKKVRIASIEAYKA